MSFHVYFLSGFLGEQEDFDASMRLLQEVGVESSYIDFREDCNWTDFERSFKSFQLSLKSGPKVFVAYSLGARLLSHYFLGKNLRQLETQLILIGCGLGVDEKQKAERISFEDSILAKIESLDFENFLYYWETLPLFSGSKKRIKSSSWSKGEALVYFNNFRQSNQESLKLFVQREEVLSLIGDKDSKYLKIYKELPHEVVPESGHRVPLDNPGFLFQKIMERGALL